MSKKCIFTLLFCLFSLAGCEKYYLSLRQVPVDVEYLASTHVGTPDPRQVDPPFGQKIVMQWAIPPEMLADKPRLIFHVIYKNHTEEEIIYPLEDRSGMEVFSVLNEQYREKGGLLTYHAEIRTQDGTVYTLHLRPEAQWSDGTPLTAEDFVFSAQRILSPRLASGLSSFFHPLKNAKAYHNGEIQDFNTVGIHALDAHTLQIELEQPLPYFLQYLASSAWYPVPKHAILAHGSVDDRHNTWTH
ncbi:MAG: hypothetical protein KBA81_03680, partial [Rhabdochlamydiaceae bacterium]|nr:hypothetical protein [Rhabdochlamydiaceae bacterium]